MSSRSTRGKKSKYFFRNYHPCGSCYSMCADQNSIPCKICTHFFHQKCSKLSQKKFNDLKSNNNQSYICSSKCYNSVLPFYCSDDIDFNSAIFGDGLYPCVKCKRDCVETMACIQCSICEVWCHHVCSTLSNEEFVNTKFFFCGSQCENMNISFLPFYECTSAVLHKEGIFLEPKLITGATGKRIEKKIQKSLYSKISF